MFVKWCFKYLVLLATGLVFIIHCNFPFQITDTNCAQLMRVIHSKMMYIFIYGVYFIHVYQDLIYVHQEKFLYVCQHQQGKWVSCWQTYGRIIFLLQTYSSMVDIRFLIKIYNKIYIHEYIYAHVRTHVHTNIHIYTYIYIYITWGLDIFPHGHVIYIRQQQQYRQVSSWYTSRNFNYIDVNRCWYILPMRGSKLYASNVGLD